MTIAEELLAMTIADRERELEGLSRLRRAQSGFRESGKRDKGWTWQIEPGMEEAFESLRSWLLSSVQDSEVEQTNTHDGLPWLD